MYAGKSSWDQYRQVFEAIICSNGWDGVTAALQLVSQSTDVSLRGPPGVRGDDPSVFAIKLETLARRAFAYVNASARLQLVRDIFIARQAECSLRRHLDSVEPDTPILDIVDRCRVWESHAEDTDNWINCHSPGPSSGGLPGGKCKYGQ